ncbi:hypothetical protein ACOBWA_01205 [Psychrobacter sp. ER1]|uniref:hypothetical protein n=1 Tax=Psychrobacter sp. ER1 TaxID=3406645 RepID=UPI003B438090
MSASIQKAPISTSSQRKVLDITKIDDDEVIILPTIMLSDIACDISGAINVLNDIGNILNLIHQRELSPNQTLSVARLSCDAAERRVKLLVHQLDAINEAMVQSKFAKVGE